MTFEEQMVDFDEPNEYEIISRKAALKYKFIKTVEIANRLLFLTSLIPHRLTTNTHKSARIVITKNIPLQKHTQTKRYLRKTLGMDITLGVVYKCGIKFM